MRFEPSQEAERSQMSKLYLRAKKIDKKLEMTAAQLKKQAALMRYQMKQASSLTESLRESKWLTSQKRSN